MRMFAISLHVHHQGFAWQRPANLFQPSIFNHSIQHSSGSPRAPPFGGEALGHLLRKLTKPGTSQALEPGTACLYLQSTMPKQHSAQPSLRHYSHTDATKLTWKPLNVHPHMSSATCNSQGPCTSCTPQGNKLELVQKSSPHCWQARLQGTAWPPQHSAQQLCPCLCHLFLAPCPSQKLLQPCACAPSGQHEETLCSHAQHSGPSLG